MARKTGKRNIRAKYAVLGDGITEQWYLKHLKDYRNYIFSIKPTLFDDITFEKAEDIIDDLLAGGCNKIIYLTDYDTLVAQDKLQSFNKFKRKYASRKDIFICESMPAIEIWFLLHFQYTTKEYVNCNQLLDDLKNHIPNYKKKKIFLQQTDWFNLMVNEEKDDQAVKNATRLSKLRSKGGTQQHFPFTRMHLAIAEFEKQKKKQA